VHRDQSRNHPRSMLSLFVVSAWLAAATAATADCDPATAAAGGLTLGANCASAPVLATEIASDVTGMIARSVFATRATSGSTQSTRSRCPTTPRSIT